MSGVMDRLYEGPINMPYDSSLQVTQEHSKNTLDALLATATDLAIEASMPGTTLPDTWTHGASLSLACIGFTPWWALWKMSSPRMSQLQSRPHQLQKLLRGQERHH